MFKGCQKCDYSPRDWCKTKQIASECDMTEFCNYNIWKPKPKSSSRKLIEIETIDPEPYCID